MSDEVWYRAECVVHDAEYGSDQLWELGAAGVEVQDRETFMEGGAIAPVPEGKTRLIAFFDLGEGEPGGLESAIAAALSPESLRVAKYEETGWQTAWRDYFHPVRLSERVMVGPPWEDFSAPKGGYKIVIEPGLAFGTGTHETTQLVGRLLDREIGDHPPEVLLDVGCGSAILSMAARYLGVKKVVGIDIDETAVGIAQETVALNELDGIDLSTRPLDSLGGNFPLVLANILGHILLEIRPYLVEAVTPGGRLIVSGVTIEQAAAFDEEFGAHPLRQIEREVLGEWVAFVYERTDG